MANKEQNILKIGIDFGGVLSVHDRIYGNNKDEKTIVSGEHRSTLINMRDALSVLAELKKNCIDGVDKIEYYVISFAGKARAKETKDSILRTCPDLFDGLYFTKSKMNKKHVCKYLGTHMMIDDTLDILTDISQQMIKGKYNCQLILFSGDPGFAEANRDNQEIHNLEQFKNIVNIVSWKEIGEFIKKIDWTKSDYAVIPDSKVDLTKHIYKV